MTCISVGKEDGEVHVCMSLVVLFVIFFLAMTCISVGKEDGEVHECISLVVLFVIFF